MNLSNAEETDFSNEISMLIRDFESERGALQSALRLKRTDSKWDEWAPKRATSNTHEDEFLRGFMSDMQEQLSEIQNELLLPAAIVEQEGTYITEASSLGETKRKTEVPAPKLTIVANKLFKLSADLEQMQSKLSTLVDVTRSSASELPPTVPDVIKVYIDQRLEALEIRIMSKIDTVLNLEEGARRPLLKSRRAWR